MSDSDRTKGQTAINSLSEAGLMSGLSQAARHLRDIGMLPPHPTAPGQFVMKIELGPDHGICLIATDGRRIVEPV